jgi:APA family basic amino acid/polyamine antiporter
VTSAAATVLVLYVGIALVALSALRSAAARPSSARPTSRCRSSASSTSLEPQWLADGLRPPRRGLAAITFIAAAQSAMLGLSRLAYSLARTGRSRPRSGAAPDPRDRRTCVS